jgi:hypothetical protein
MGSSRKRQQTIAKRNRERAVEEKRTLKRLKKQQAKADRAAGIDPQQQPGFDGEQAVDGETEPAERTIDGETGAPEQREPPVELGETG